MASFKLVLKSSAERELRKLPKSEIPRLSNIIQGLADDPFPYQSLKLSGSANAYRIRVGDYRIVYTVENKVLLVTVIRIAHRRDVYRSL
jgi:mRNA interferase RelE/StbE